MLDIKELDFIFPKKDGLSEDSIYVLNPNMRKYQVFDFETHSQQFVFEFKNMDKEAWFIVLMFWMKSEYLKIFDITERTIQCAHHCGLIKEPDVKELLIPTNNNRSVGFRDINMRYMALRFLNFQENLPFTAMSALQMAFHYNNIQLMAPPQNDENINETNKRIQLQKHTIDTVIPALDDFQQKIQARQTKLNQEKEKLLFISKEGMRFAEPTHDSGMSVSNSNQKTISPEEGGFIIE